MALAWKAGWVQALGSSNLPSSAHEAPLFPQVGGEGASLYEEQVDPRDQDGDRGRVAAPGGERLAGLAEGDVAELRGDLLGAGDGVEADAASAQQTTPTSSLPQLPAARAGLVAVTSWSR